MARVRCRETRNDDVRVDDAQVRADWLSLLQDFLRDAIGESIARSCVSAHRRVRERQ